MSNIVKNYFKILEVIRSLNCASESKSGVGRKDKLSDFEIVALSLTAEFMSIDSENSLFKQINQQEISNLIERSQFNKRREKLFLFSEEIRTKLASHFLEFEKYLLSIACLSKYANSRAITELKSVKMSLKLHHLMDFVPHKTISFMGINFMGCVL